jgi:hypothetical protein
MTKGVMKSPFMRQTVLFPDIEKAVRVGSDEYLDKFSVVLGVIEQAAGTER